MADFKKHDINTAPEGAKPFLENSRKSFGMIPGLHGVMAESPQVLEVILVLSQKVMSNYINHIAETPVDEPFRKFAWSKNQ